MVRRAGLLAGLALMVGCSSDGSDLNADDIDAPGTSSTVVVTTTEPSTTTAAPTTEATTTTTTTAAPSTTVSPSTTVPTTTAPATTAPSTAPPTSAAPASTTTTTTVPALDVHDPECVLEVNSGDTLLGLIQEFDDQTVNLVNLRAENGIVGDLIDPGQLIDMCVENGVDDITGDTRPERSTVPVEQAVMAQQEQLNALFAGLGTPELLVDGISGPVTRQRLCAFRLANGIEPSLADMEPGSAEEALLLFATELPIPQTSAVESNRWILIDLTCQIMFVGNGADHLQFVFPTSTGNAEFPTRQQDRSRAFKYNPASHNNGWHDSYDYPAAEDNPLNGNMYRPLYFDRGQAIHGANNVPTSPASHGCARLRTNHQDALVDWLGLGGLTSITTSTDTINVTVNVQGSYPW